MKLRPQLLPFVILLSSSGLLPAAPPKELVSLQQSYAFAVAERVTAPHETALAALNAKFTAALDNAAAQAKSTGDLATVLAIQADKKRLADKLPLPDDDEKTPEGLKKLRAIYRDQLTKLEAQRSANTAALLTPYTAKLQELEVSLTKADRIAEAQEVMAYREGLAAGSSTPVMAATEAKKTESPPAPIGAAVQPPPGKGDDRAAAELILSLGGKVMLSGKPEFIEDATLLPKGRFTLARITFTEAKMKRKLEAADADKLMHLAELYYFTVNASINDDETLRFLATCPNLQFVHVENCRWLTGSWLQYIAPLKNVTSLTALEAAKSDTSAFARFQSLSLTSSLSDFAKAPNGCIEQPHVRPLRQYRPRHTDAPAT